MAIQSMPPSSETPLMDLVERVRVAFNCKDIHIAAAIAMDKSNFNRAMRNEKTKGRTNFELMEKIKAKFFPSEQVTITRTEEEFRQEMIIDNIRLKAYVQVLQEELAKVFAEIYGSSVEEEQRAIDSRARAAAERRLRAL